MKRNAWRIALGFNSLGRSFQSLTIFPGHPPARMNRTMDISEAMKKDRDNIEQDWRAIGADIWKSYETVTGSERGFVYAKRKA